MLRMVVCCGGGMSSSVLSQQFNNTIKEQHWEGKISVEYLPLIFLYKHQEKFDIAMVCPHSRYHAIDLVKSGKVSIPLYMIPARLYGSMKLVPLVEDAVDALKIYHDTGENPVHFPEESLLETKRDTSHRRWIKKHPVQ